MKIPVAGLMLSAALVLATGVEARDRIADSPHVRAATPEAAAFVAAAVSRSQVVGDLARKLEQGNVVAYVHLAPSQPGHAASALRFAGRSTRQRFVVVTISSELRADRQVALLGHELQHVTEISHAAWVSNQADFQSLLSMIGWRDASRATGYETSAALLVERHVAREIGTAGHPTP